MNTFPLASTPSAAGASCSRQAAARSRMPAARAALRDCHLCACHCGVDRWHGGRGRCGAGAEARIFSAQVEVSDELEWIPVYAVAFSGCDMRCAFCITGAQSWNARAGVECVAHEVGEAARAALRQGARSIMILGGEPTIHLPSVLELVAAFPEDARLIWKTNAHGTAQARQLLGGLFDVWLADYKFGNDHCAQRLAGVSNYTAIVRENMMWAKDDSELVVRHLLMPGHVDCCWKPVARWLGRELPGVKVNLRSGFWPAWHARRHRELRSTTQGDEARVAWRIAEEHGLSLMA